MTFLYAVFVSPLFDLSPFFAFADDKQVIESDSNLVALITNMEIRLEMITKWLRDSGLVVNEEKPEKYFLNDTHFIIKVGVMKRKE